jgi:DnaK suppressor protein
MHNSAEPVDIDHFRARLLQARAALLDLETERQASSATVELDQSSVGRLSRMDALQQQAMAQSIRRRAGELLRCIDDALGRCVDGSYGACLDCGERIDPRRLGLDPAVALCIGCAEVRDR